jgi:hypothetical protein
MYLVFGEDNERKLPFTTKKYVNQLLKVAPPDNLLGNPLKIPKNGKIS